MTNSMEKIRVIVNGAHGRMGQETIKAIQNDASLILVAETTAQDDLTQIILAKKAQVVIDFTTPSSVYSNVKTIISANAHPVIGTTGLTTQQITELQQLCAAKKLGGIIAPNFSVGAILMMKFAAEAAKYLSHGEIIEFHHENKKDAPSGTALKTAEMMAKNRKQIPNDNSEKEILQSARGADKDNIHIHSVRLPGFIASQEVVLGGLSESLKIRHDSIHRESFMPGVILACKKVLELQSLVYGLENILFE